jgi:hypothetical protein
MDDDNIRIGLQALGVSLSYRRLQSRLAAQAAVLHPWAVLTHRAGELSRARYLAERGWRVLPVTREYLIGRQSVTVKGNADHELAFLAGRLAVDGRFDSVLLGTGDGDLAVALARCVKAFVGIPVSTISVPGSSSQRLRDAALFTRRLLVGRDLVVPSRSRATHNRRYGPRLYRRGTWKLQSGLEQPSSCY